MAGHIQPCSGAAMALPRGLSISHHLTGFEHQAEQELPVSCLLWVSDSLALAEPGAEPAQGKVQAGATGCLLQSFPAKTHPGPGWDSPWDKGRHWDKNGLFAHERGGWEKQCPSSNIPVFSPSRGLPALLWAVWRVRAVFLHPRKSRSCTGTELCFSLAFCPPSAAARA